MNRAIFYLVHVGNSLGFYQNPFSKQWDVHLNNILDDGIISKLDQCTVCFLHEGKEKEIWISNRFYSYGFLRRIDGDAVPESLNCRPRAKTMLRLNHLVSELVRSEKNKLASDFRKKHQL